MSFNRGNRNILCYSMLFEQFLNEVGEESVLLMVECDPYVKIVLAFFLC